MPPEDSDRARDYIRAVEAAKQPEGGSSPEVGLQYALTDQGNGERLARQHGDDLRYVADHKRWYVWSRCSKGALHWVADNTGEAMRRAKLVAVNISNPHGAINLKQSELDAWSLKSQDSGALEAMLKLGRSERPIPATPDAFDPDAMVFGVQNGTINLTTGEFYEPRREDMLSKCAGTRYVAEESDQQTAKSNRQEGSHESSTKADSPMPPTAQTLDAIPGATVQPGTQQLQPQTPKPKAAAAGLDSSDRPNTVGPVSFEAVQATGALNNDAENLAGVDRAADIDSSSSAEPPLGQAEGPAGVPAVVGLNPAALCPTWENFLRVVQADDEEVIQFLQRCVGYSMTGLVKERVLLILYGGGANGKSTFIETLHALFGDYAKVTPADTLLAKKFGGSSIPNDIAALKGVRFVSASETDENANLATSKLKGMTGGGRLSARFMGGEFFEFQTTFKLWLETNHKPRITDSSKAMFDRIRLVPFKVRIPEEQQDKNLKEKLLAELPGILNWALAGLKQYLEIGLCPPAKVVEETARYQQEQDVLGIFLSDCYEEKASGLVSKKTFYSDYVLWCKEAGEFAISKNTLGRRMNDRGFDPEVRERLTPGGRLERVWQGITAKERPATAVRPGNTTFPDEVEGMFD
jgi:P4 family phage/plasmid primase-like protien